MTSHLPYLVYAFFFTAGMPWLSPPGFEGLKWFQVVLVLTVTLVFINKSTRPHMLRVMNAHSLLITIIIFWMIFATISTLFAASFWSIIDIQKLFFYFIFSFSLAAIIIYKGEKISLALCGLATLLGIVVAMVSSFSTIINDIPSLTLLALSNGDPRFIIHGIFAKGDVSPLNAAGEATRDLSSQRHTISGMLVVNACLMAYIVSQRKAGLVAVFVLVASILLAILLLSRSAWIVLFLLFIMFFIKTISLRRVTPFQLFIIFLIVLIISSGLYYAQDLIVERLSRTTSIHNRSRSLQRGLMFLMENWTPASVEERFSKRLWSSHNFILDSSLNAGFGGALSAFLIAIYLTAFIARNMVRRQQAYLAVAAFMLIIRMITNGGGIPNITGFVGLGALIALSLPQQRLSSSEDERNSAMDANPRLRRKHQL